MAHRVLVDPELLALIDMKVMREHDQRLYRPVVSAIIESVEKEILFVHVSAGGFWSFPQGGIERGENVIDALFREVLEETEIPSDVLTVRKFCYGDRIDIPNWQRDGFTMGKSYYYFHVIADGVPDVVVDYREAFEHRWIPRRDATDLTLQLWDKRGMKSKSSSMYFALQDALRA